MPASALDPRVAFPQTPDSAGRLDRRLAPEHPLALLGEWLEHVLAIGALQPHYVTLATASADGIPSSRTVQLLTVEDDALLFTTNLGSRKGVEMLQTGHAAVSIYWRETAQSVNVTGTVVIADEAESDARFATEDRGVQAARTVSFHGLPLPDEAEQLERFHALASGTEPIERPEHWQWFRIIPDAVTFWEGVPGALNRRLHYARTDDRWRRMAIQA
jgi:pyridoxamine 5'-phosphate oxidase